MQADRKIEDQKSNTHAAGVKIFKTNKKKLCLPFLLLLFFLFLLFR
jgi:hypothetical protein